MIQFPLPSIKYNCFSQCQTDCGFSLNRTLGRALHRNPCWLQSGRKEIPLVPLVFGSKIPPTGGLRNNNSLLTVLEAGSLRSHCQHGRGRALFPVQSCAVSLCPHVVKGGGSCGVSFRRPLILSRGLHLHYLITPPIRPPT